jgi:L-arabinose isomerase
MKVKPKLGVFLVSGAWFREVGMQASGSSLTNEVDAIAEHVFKKVSVFSETVYSGVITSVKSAKEAAAIVKEKDVDAILIAPLMWCEDIILKTISKELPGKPIIFCTFMAYKSFKEYMSVDEMLKGTSTVGSLQMSGFLSKEGFNYVSVVGYYDDNKVYEEIKKHSLAIAINRGLRDINCGVLPFRCDQMTVTYVDEFNLHSLYGIELKYLELQKIKDIAMSFTENQITDFEKIIRNSGFEIEVDDRNLKEALKYSLAIEKAIKDEDLKIFAMNDVSDEMHDCFGLRPCLINPGLTEYGISIPMEADISAGIAMHILSEFTKEASFYSEILCADLKDNTFIAGHAGYYDIQHCDPSYPVKIISDPEYKNTDRFTGACVYYKYKPGPVTAVNSIYDGNRLKWMAIEGMSLPGPPKLEGYCHAYCRIDKPLVEFFKESIESGVSQHWVLTPGHIADDLKLLCRWNNIVITKLS